MPVESNVIQITISQHAYMATLQESSYLVANMVFLLFQNLLLKVDCLFSVVLLLECLLEVITFLHLI